MLSSDEITFVSQGTETAMSVLYCTLDYTLGYNCKWYAKFIFKVPSQVSKSGVISYPSNGGSLSKIHFLLLECS